jgi:UDP:flavonoid glycosyltransferase YjiC (YdhE family)
MRLLFCASGATGHVLPMRPLCDALLQRGHEIAWVTSKTMASLLPMSQISLYQSTRDISFYRTKIIDAWPKSAAQSKREWSEQVLAPKLFALIADETCDCLRAIAERWKPDAIIYESCALAAPLVAAQLGLPSVHHGFGIRRSTIRLGRFAAEMASIWQRYGLTAPDHGTYGESAFIDLTPPGITTDPAPSDVQRFPMRPVHLTTDSATSVRGTAKTSPDTTLRRPRVYLTFGTVQHGNPNLLLAARSLASLPIQLRVTTADQALRSEIAALGEHVIADGFTAQSEILPNVDYVVSHAGSGTCLGALAYGLAQLCLPQGADQFFNSDVISSIGAGLALNSDQQSESEIARAMRQIMRDPSYGNAARAIANQIAAMPTADDVAERVVSWIAQTAH